METSMTAQTARHATTTGEQLLGRENDITRGNSIDPVTLAYLDFGLFKSLFKLGVSRERICSTLTISYEDFDYLRKLSIT